MENIRPIVWVLMGTSFMAIIGVLVMYRMELFGASERFITNTKLFYTVLAVASWVILMTTPDRKDGLKDNEVFQAMHSVHASSCSRKNDLASALGSGYQ